MVVRLLVLAGVVLGLYALYCALLYAQQRGMMFPGTSIPAPAEPRLPAGMRATRLSTPAGSIDAWLLPPGSAPGPVVVFAHGNFELVDHADDIVEGFRALGVGVLLVEYPGYGRSTGAPTLASLDAAFEAAYDWLATQPEADRTRIFAMGRSVGTGPAARLASRRPVAGLVLQSPFARVADFAARMGVPPVLVRDPFDNVDAVARYAGPVLVLHGRRDEVIPFSHGERIARARSGVTLQPLDCGHNDCPGDAAEYWRAIARLVHGDPPR